MAGWALVRYRFRARWLIVALIFGTLTLPYFVVVIPQFIMVARDMGLSNTWFALIVPPLFNSLGVLFMRQAFTMMPADLFDAAQVEGVSEWRIFTRVALPMARPTIAAPSPTVEHVKYPEQDEAAQQHGSDHMRDGPAERDALQEAEEQRRVAQGCQRAADVGDQEDEEHQHVGVVAALEVGLD